MQYAIVRVMKTANTLTEAEMPYPANPHHVENLNALGRLEAQGFVGLDASLEESLFEYGLAWRDIGDEWLFVYAHPSIENRFDRCALPKNTDPAKEWDWVQWGEIYSFTGMSETDWKALPLPEQVSDLISYHGVENVFGSSYWEGFEVAR